jgi:hypothetical protein
MPLLVDYDEVPTADQNSVAEKRMKDGWSPYWQTGIDRVGIPRYPETVLLVWVKSTVLEKTK